MLKGMVFSSPVFLFVFLPTVLLAHFLAGRRFRNGILLVFSLLFYAWGEPAFVLVILASIAANWVFGMTIEDASGRSRKAALCIALAFNLGLLVFFKYAAFFAAEIANPLLGAARLPLLEVQHIRLPLGISFFTFQAISYVIDVWRREVRAERNLARLALFKTLFPQLIAGPIVRYKDVAAELRERTLGWEKYYSGIRRFATGLGKKVLIANTCGQVADRIFALSPAELSAPVAWLGAAAYALQIYFDFSGYSDMAIGLGRMLGFDFLENFNYPYVARSVREFWRRWHISLSTWFRDYLYRPLGGNRFSDTRTYANLLLVFFLCGLWHGASWTFVLWGLFHGAFLIFERTAAGRFLDRLPAPAARLYTLAVVLCGWVIFRAESVAHAGDYLAAMAGFSGGRAVIADYAAPEFMTAFLAGVIGSTPWMRIFVSRRTASASWTLAECAGISAVLLASSAFLAGETYNPFIYFRF